ncbi:MAG TPA: hypothetical protein VJ652_10205 [Noviherbaspirillum sp.]|nr:hypothetical protein [Noviherbaspirillum sp.]
MPPFPEVDSITIFLRICISIPLLISAAAGSAATINHPNRGHVRKPESKAVCARSCESKNGNAREERCFRKNESEDCGVKRSRSVDIAQYRASDRVHHVSGRHAGICSAARKQIHTVMHNVFPGHSPQ